MSTVEDTELIDSFEQFFRDYYHDAIGDLARTYPGERRSLYIDWDDLYRFDPDLADDYLAQPEQLQEYAEEALRLYDLPIDVSLGRAHVRVQNLPETTDIRAIRAEDVNRMVAIRGIVRKATDVRPKVREAAFQCQRCGTITRVPQTGGTFQEPHECNGCDRQGPFRLDEDQSEFVDAQRLRVQESPEGLRGGETPQNIDVDIEDDITGEVSPGDRVRVTGILRLDQESNADSPIFDVYMDGVAVELEEEEFEDMNITDEDKQAIVELSEHEDVYDRMIDSIAPSIHGYEQEKLAIAMQLFSGVTKELPDESRIRGDLHILLIGDPGTGKSQLLQYIRNIAPRSVYTSGKGSSSAGLTAAAVRDDFGEGQQWTLEAGALVLADQGIAAVDELDKMRPEDRSAMHEALEQQSYHPDTTVLLADGRRVTLGEFVDTRMNERREDIIDGVNCELLSVDDIRIHTVDVETNETLKTNIDRISRHKAPDKFVRVRFSNGREITVTPDHPMFVDGERGIETVSAADMTEGMSVPAPRKLPNKSAAVELTSGSEYGANENITVPETVTPDLAEILGILTAKGAFDAGATHGLSVSTEDKQLLARIGRLMTDVFGIESTDPPTADIPTKQWTATTLCRWFEDNFPSVMHSPAETRMPAAVLGASEEVIRRFLHGGFAVDGSIKDEMMGFSAASAGLAQDYADALLKLGITSRIRHDTMEESWDVDVIEKSTECFIEDVVVPLTSRESDASGCADRDIGQPGHHDIAPSRTTVDLQTVEDRCELRYTKVTAVETIPNDGEAATEWVYDITVEPTNTFVSQGVVLHNSISVSKAGINATLKSRCSLLGAANPTYGRFDHYEPIGEQIDLEPALISRFDLIFTVTDQPDPEEDRQLAQHILTTNYAGELNTQRERMPSPDISRETVENIQEEVEPVINPELLRKYVAYAKQNCHPRMTEAARSAIEEFYVDLRSQGADEDDPVPVTARKLEALVRLAEASARIRLSDTVTEADATRVIEIVRSSLQNIGVDPETGQFDADVVETGTSASQRQRIKEIKDLIRDMEPDHDDGVPVENILDRANEVDLDRRKAEEEIERLKQKGEVYEPSTDHVRTT